MKKTAALLAAAVMILAAFTSCAKYTHIVITTQQFGDFFCSIYEDDTIEIVKYTGEAASVEVPSGINGRTVVDISTRAFEDCATVEEVFLPSSLSKLPSKLFDGCPNLKSVYIPLSVKSIGKNLIADCPSFTTVQYAGTEAQWSSVGKGNVLTENFTLSSAEIIYEYDPGE